MRRRRLAAATAGVVVLALPACGADSDSVGAPSTAGAANTIHVKAVDYAFQGVPPSVKAGSRFTLTNASAVEVHELVAIRLPDDEKRVAVDILKDPASRGALFASGPPAAVIVAAPSSAMPGVVQGDGTLTRPGRYLFLCSIPTGADPGAYLEAAKTATGPVQVAGGPPHSAKGMVAEVTVTS